MTRDRLRATKFDLEPSLKTAKFFGLTILVSTTLVAVLLVSVPGALPQARDSVGDDERERVFVEALRREDPGGAERYLALRDARKPSPSSNESRRGTARPDPSSDSSFSAS